MKFSPANIKKQEFSKAVRGYNKEEVVVFLERLADEFGLLMKENDALKQELESVKLRLAEYVKVEKNLQNTLLKARETSARAIETAKKQTALMLKEADQKAVQVIERARKSADEMRDAVIQLREEKNLIISKLKSIITSQAQLLETKVEDAVTETGTVKNVEPPEGPDINTDEIVNKLL